MLLGVCSRTDQSHLCRHEGLAGLLDKRLNRAWRHKRLSMKSCGWLIYTAGVIAGKNVKHFHAWHRRDHGGGGRSCRWVKNV